MPHYMARKNIPISKTNDGWRVEKVTTRLEQIGPEQPKRRNKYKPGPHLRPTAQMSKQ